MSTVAAFAPSSYSSGVSRRYSLLSSTVEAVDIAVDVSVAVVSSEADADAGLDSSLPVSIGAAEIKTRLDSMLEKLRKKDASSMQLTKEVRNTRYCVNITRMTSMASSLSLDNILCYLSCCFSWCLTRLFFLFRCLLGN